MVVSSAGPCAALAELLPLTISLNFLTTLTHTHTRLALADETVHINTFTCISEVHAVGHMLAFLENLD